MNRYVITGRTFLAISLAGIGVLHLIFPGVRPVIIPDLAHLPAQLYWLRYAIALLLIVSGVFIAAGKQVKTLALVAGIAFFLLFLFGHLPPYLSATDRAGKLKYWVNLNKTLALSGGFLVLAALPADNGGVVRTRFDKIILVTGRIFVAIMLFVFGLGHLLSTGALSSMVPGYIPFAVFWTFLGGIVLVGAAISFVVAWQMKTAAQVLAAQLFLWFLTLHLYYAFLYPDWQQGEHFVGALTCLAFCGTALLISQSAKLAVHPNTSA